MANHFWIINPRTKEDSYCVNSNGFLVRLKVSKKDAYKFVSLSYEEATGIMNMKKREEKYAECERIFNIKYPQPEEYKKELSKEEQANLEKVLLTHKNL
jgi:hypothetical protein